MDENSALNKVGVPGYLYIFELLNSLTNAELADLQKELGRIFHTNDVRVENGKYVELRSSVPPDEEVDASLQKLKKRFGPIQFRAGSKLG